MNQILIGFDVRIIPTDSCWTSERAQQFLLLGGTEPRSVDPEVWPRPPESPFGRGRGARYFSDDQARAIPVPGALVIGISAVTRPDAAPPVPFPDLAEPPDWERWVRIGYDVGDFVMLSGLMNCAWKPSDRLEWAGRWGPHLNGAHLVISVDHALQMAKEMGRRVPEHAPFFAYGIYVAPGW